MKLVRLLALGAVVAASQGCTRDTTGSVVTLDPLAGLRYVNLVADTGAMDFRVIDIVGDAPNTVGASFRTGGAPNGVTNPTPTSPPYLPVRAGTRQIRVFMSGTTAAVASTVMFDTTFTFVAGTNYTMYLYGYARAGQGGVRGVINADVIPTIPQPVAITQTAMTAITTAADTIFATSGSWISQGVKVGDDVTLTNHATAGNNNRMFRVVSVTATKVALLGTPLTVNAAPDSSFTLTILGKTAGRVIHLGSSMTGATTSFPTPAVDVYLDTLAAAAAPVLGTASFGAVIPGEVRPYKFFTARTLLGANPAINYRAAMTAAGGPAATFVQADIPAGTVGTSTANPVAGEIVVGTAFTVVISPRAVAGSQAEPAGSPAAFLNPAVFVIIDQKPPRTAP